MSFASTQLFWMSHLFIQFLEEALLISEGPLKKMWEKFVAEI